MADELTYTATNNVTKLETPTHRVLRQPWGSRSLFWETVPPFTKTPPYLHQSVQHMALHFTKTHFSNGETVCGG